MSLLVGLLIVYLVIAGLAWIGALIFLPLRRPLEWLHERRMAAEYAKITRTVNKFNQELDERWPHLRTKSARAIVKL
jgi:hypothetical protein